ncbi:MAG: asparagine--tRNA ligase [Oscillospiraceae bacterium]|nr:asparagine--tRNA ligase [Oscillospiraceae bacterium]
MERTLIKRLYESREDMDGRPVRVSGWVRSARVARELAFVDLYDGSTVKGAQLVVTGALPNFEAVSKLNGGASLICIGKLRLTPEARQPFEITAEAIEITGLSHPDYPMQKKRHSLEFLRTVPHLRPRAATFQAVFRVRSEISFAVHDFFRGRGFVCVHTPLITGSDAEGAGEMFRVTVLDPSEPPRTPEGKADFSKDFFGRLTSLTVSGQLEAESFAQAFSNVYTFGPTFRAENSNTPRHAAEFWMIEPEMAFCDLAGDMDMAEAMIKHVITHTLSACPHEMEFLNAFIDNSLLERLRLAASAVFERMTYTRAVEFLERAGDRFRYPVGWGCDLQTEHERYITEEICGRPVFLTDYPKELKAFYMRLNDDGRTAAAMDLLVPGVGELVGGSQREERLDVLLRRMSESGMAPEDYEGYLALRRYGTVKHAGFGLGLERLVMYMTGMSNIRDVIPFPRTPGSLM